MGNSSANTHDRRNALPCTTSVRRLRWRPALYRAVRAGPFRARTCLCATACSLTALTGLAQQ
eukprot:1964006-Pleurochrysis_carterae.AAC.3